jgi:hypothetical protein
MLAEQQHQSESKILNFLSEFQHVPQALVLTASDDPGPRRRRRLGVTSVTCQCRGPWLLVPGPVAGPGVVRLSPC